MQLRTLAILLLFPLSACTPPHANTPDHAQPVPISLEGWASETFALPPGFAPDLPTGSESLRFAPGWRTPEAEGFWSYAFIMSIDEPTPDAARLRVLLEKYYNGLMATFAAGQTTHPNPPLSPARIDIHPTAANRYEATMHVTDAFATFKPITLRLLIESSPHPASSTANKSAPRSLVRVQLSPQPPTHPIWRSLDAALASIPTP